MKSRTIKLLEEVLLAQIITKVGNNFLEQTIIFLKDKLDFIKIKTLKETMQEMKVMPQVRRNYSQCIYMKKILVSRKYKEFSQLKNRKAKNPMSKRFGQIFGNEDIQMTSKHIQKMPSIISHQENTN